MIESIDAEYINISIYSLLSACSYIKLPVKLRNSMKDLINIKNSDNKCFLWCLTRHLDQLKIHPERIIKAYKNVINDLNYEGIELPESRKDYWEIKQKNNICINVFCYENNLVYPVYASNKKLENCNNLLFITDENKSHYVYINDLNRFMCNKIKDKNKKFFCKYCLQCFSSEKVLIEHKETCLKINVKLKSVSTGFKNHFKQLAVPFKIYADFESLLKRVRAIDKIIMLHRLKNIKIIFFAVLLTKLFVLMINLASQLFFTEEKMQSINLLKQLLKSMIIAKKIIKKGFNKNLLVSTEDEERFQSSNKCWICNKLFDVGDNKVRDHCHITGKYRGSAHWICSINLRLTKEVPVIFHNFRSYYSHLIKEIVKFDVKVSVQMD